jgi:hypothetical protein
MTSYVSRLGSAPRSHPEFVAMFDGFRGFMLGFTVAAVPRAILPRDWPDYFWRNCACGSNVT